MTTYWLFLHWHNHIFRFQTNNKHQIWLLPEQFQNQNKIAAGTTKPLQVTLQMLHSIPVHHAKRKFVKDKKPFSVKDVIHGSIEHAIQTDIHIYIYTYMHHTNALDSN